MKKTTLITAAMAVAFGLSACTDAEMAQVEKDMAQGASDTQSKQSMVDAERDCKTFVSGKTTLPMAAISVSRGNYDGSTLYIPVVVKWDEPFVDERGECKVVGGSAVSYRVMD